MPLRPRKRFPRFGFLLGFLLLASLVGLVIMAFKAGDATRRDGEVKSGLVNIRKEAEILADGYSYAIVCQDPENTGFGLPVGVPERNKIGQFVQIIIDNSPDKLVDKPVCSVSPAGDSVAFFNQTSKGAWCVDSRGNEGYGYAAAFGGVCLLR